MEDDDTKEDGADGAHADPDRVPDADGQGFECDREQRDAADDTDDGEDGWPEACEAVGLFHGDREDDFEDGCETEIEPRHGAPALLDGSVVSEGDADRRCHLIVCVMVAHAKRRSF